MVVSEDLFVDGERSFAQGKRFGGVADGREKARQIATPAVRVGMLRAEHLLADRQRALMDLPGRSEVPLVVMRPQSLR
jgi:hypothetical protein